MGLFNKSKADKDELSAEERAARREQRRAERNRKKKGGDDSDEPESKKSDKQVGANRSRKDESVLRETVFETAVSMMKANKLFRVSRDDEDLCVGILMKFDDIGGLSKKDMKNESKGQIITLINNGGIASIFTADLKSKDQIVFIPNASSLAQMAEFSLLADDLEYELVLVSPYDELIENTGVFVDLDYLQKCHDNGQSISVKLAKVLEPTLLPGDAGYSDAAQAAQPVPAAQAAASTFDMSEDDEQDSSSDEPEYNDSMPDDNPDDSDSGDYDGFNDYSGEFGSDGEDGSEFDDDGSSDEELESEESGDGSDSGSDSDSNNSEPVYIGAETSSMALSRKFFNDDMARDLDTMALEQAIAGIGQFRPLLQRPDDTWLSQQMNVMIDLANQELFALHQKNLDVVRNAYLTAIGNAYIDVMSRVQDYKSDERYEGIASEVENAAKGIDELVKSEREKLKAEWDDKVQKAGEVARINAEQTYRERYMYQYEERMRNIDAEVRAGLQAAENRAVADLKAARQREAQIKLDQLDSQEIAKAVAAYQELLGSEAELYKKHEQEILKFLEDNRKSEIARVKILDSELQRDDQIAQIQSEYKTKAEALQADFDARIAGLQSDIDMLRSRHSRDLADKDAAYQELQTKYEADKAEWKAQVKELTDEVIRANDSKAREVKIRVAEMQAERDSYSQKYDHLVKTQKSTSMLLIALAAVAVLAALMVGIVLGGKFNSTHPVAPENPPAITDTQTPDSQSSGDVSNPDVSNPAGQDGNNTGAQGSDNTPDPAPGPEDDPGWAAMQDPVI